MLIFNIIIRYRNFVWSKIKKIKKKAHNVSDFWDTFKKMSNSKKKSQNNPQISKGYSIISIKNQLHQNNVQHKKLNQKRKNRDQSKTLQKRYWKTDSAK